MRMEHLLVEVFCGYEGKKKKGKKKKRCYLKDKSDMGIHCFDNCKYLSYTICPHEIALSDETGLVKDFYEDCAGFGGEMDPNPCSKDYEKNRKILLKKWKEICRQKISDACDELLEYKGKNNL